MSRVFVLDQNKKPLDPCHPARARELLFAGRAAVFRHKPFTIILRDRRLEDSVTHPHRVKLDPGSKTTGIALVNEATDTVVWAAELMHRGQAIKARLDARRSLRRGRRTRKTRYRKARFLNRTRPKGWMPPSLMHRVSTTMTWARKLMRWTPIEAVTMELVKFDTQKLVNPEIAGAEYQQGELLGYEVREYLLEKFSRTCAYCDKTDVPFEIDHVVPRSKGGSDRVSNLALSCHICNQKKGNQDLKDFLANDPQRAKRIIARCKAPLRDAASVNATRWKLLQELKTLGLPVETGTGGRTKWNRTRMGFPKSHWLDAACVGASTPEGLSTQDVRPVLIKATGHGNRQVCGTDKYGFPIRHKSRQGSFFGFKTGDLVKAVVTKGKHIGTHIGRVVCRERGSFRLNGFDVSWKNCQIIQQKDGYAYT